MPPLPLDVLAETFPGILDLKTRLATRSLEGYQSDATLYLRWCDYDSARALDVATFRAWRNHLVDATTRSPNTINRRLHAIRTLVGASAAREAIDQAIAFRFRLVEPVGRASLRTRLKAQHTLTPDQVRALLRRPDPTTLAGLRDRALLTTLVGSGCRISELLALTSADLRPEGEAWFLEVLGKGQTYARRAPCSGEAVTWIRRWLDKRAKAGVDVALIFTGFTGRSDRPTRQGLRRNAAWRRVKTYGAHVGLPWLTPHDLRRFVGTQVAERHDLRAAQKALGHAHLNTTAQFYVRDALAPGLTEGLY
jgi:integrase/recombinase XerD